LCCEVSTSHLGQVGPSFDAGHKRCQPSQQRSLVAVTCADLQDVLCSASPSAWIIRADSDGWVVTWPCGMRTGSS
jgi:hypothetical protein